MRKDTHIQETQEMDANAFEERCICSASVVGNILCENVKVGKPVIRSRNRCLQEFPTDVISTGIDLSCCVPEVRYGAYLELCEDSKCFLIPYVPRKWLVVTILHKYNLVTRAVRDTQQHSIESPEFDTPDECGELYGIRRSVS